MECNLLKEAIVITDLNLKELQEELEQMRLDWIDVVVKKGIFSTDAIQLSQALDNKIHEYYCLQKILLIDKRDG
jgi:hypothetical protein